MNLMTIFVVTTIVAVVICTGILTYLNTKRQKTQMLEEVRIQARAIVDQLISTRKVIAEKQKARNTDSKGNLEFKGVIPAIVGREVAEHFSQTTILQEQSEELIRFSRPFLRWILLHSRTPPTQKNWQLQKQEDIVQ